MTPRRSWRSFSSPSTDTAQSEKTRPKLSTCRTSVALLEAFYNSGKPIALVCHSPGLLRHVTYQGAPLGKENTQGNRHDVNSLMTSRRTKALCPDLVVVVTRSPKEGAQIFHERCGTADVTSWPEI
jgi:hypothetical protein